MSTIGALSKRLQALNAASAGVYSTADLAVILDRADPSRLTEAIRWLLREGVLLRVRRGLYVDRVHGYRAEIVGQRWVAPSYLSTESALDRHGMCQTAILAYTYVTTRLISRRELGRRKLDEHRFAYRHLAKHLFFGYEPRDGLLLAEPEKAAIDFLYFTYRKQISILSPSDIDFGKLNPRRYMRFLSAFRQAGFQQYAREWLFRSRTSRT